jgi:hypothetical protein
MSTPPCWERKSAVLASRGAALNWDELDGLSRRAAPSNSCELGSRANHWPLGRFIWVNGHAAMDRTEPKLWQEFGAMLRMPDWLHVLKRHSGFSE